MLAFEFHNARSSRAGRHSTNRLDLTSKEFLVLLICFRITGTIQHQETLASGTRLAQQLADTRIQLGSLAEPTPHGVPRSLAGRESRPCAAHSFLVGIEVEL